MYRQIRVEISGRDGVVGFVGTGDGIGKRLVGGGRFIPEMVRSAVPRAPIDTILFSFFFV